MTLCRLRIHCYPVGREDLKCGIISVLLPMSDVGMSVATSRSIPCWLLKTLVFTCLLLFLSKIQADFCRGEKGMEKAIAFATVS